MMDLRLLMLVLILSGCAPDYLTRRDFQPSITALSVNKPELALEKFPS